MAEGLLDVVLAAPERTPVQIQATEVIVPGAAGIFSVLTGHTPFLTTLATGVLIVFTHDNQKLFFAVHGGFAEVRANTVTILANVVEREERIELSRAEAARARALDRLKHISSDVDVARAEAALARAMARLQAKAKEGY